MDGETKRLAEYGDIVPAQKRNTLKKARTKIGEILNTNTQIITKSIQS